MPIYQSSTNQQMPRIFTLSNAQNVGTYDIFTAVTDTLVCVPDIFSDTATTGLTSISILTSDSTPYVVLTSTEGLLASLTASTHITFVNKNVWFILKSGKKLQHKINTTNGTAGSMRIGILYFGSIA